MGFIIPGQEDIPSQHVAFQTVATAILETTAGTASIADALGDRWAF